MKTTVETLSFHIFKEGGPSVITDFQGALKGNIEIMGAPCPHCLLRDVISIRFGVSEVCPMNIYF